MGYSGGADSTCLLTLLAELGWDIVAAHLSHGMRPEAETELKLCSAYAESLGIPFAAGRADVPQLSEDAKVGLEEAGRIARYNFFGQAARSTECTRIATAHTRSDLAETVVLNLVRGAGLSGLAGIPREREDVVRPLLFASRGETVEFCASRGLWTHDDPANADISFARARVRHRILPEAECINPRVEEAISRLAELVSEEDRFLDGMAAAALERSEIVLNGELAFLTKDVEACFDRSSLLHLPETLLRRAIRLTARALGSGLDHRQTAVIISGLIEGTSGSVTTEGGLLILEWSPSDLHVREARPTTPFRYPLVAPGETASDEFGWRFAVHEQAASELEPNRSSLTVELNRAALKGAIYFRTAQPGDRLRPLGAQNERKASDLIGEAKLTLAARARLPIVCDLAGPIWIPGVCLEERMRPAEGPVYLVEFGPI